jgi:Holliday junction DNA helicase RuvA
MEGNVGRIVSVPGIGRKTAERLILELKNKAGEIKAEGEKVSIPTVKHEAIAALTTLGYNIKSAESVVLKVFSSYPDCTLEELIKKSLSELNK